MVSVSPPPLRLFRRHPLARPPERAYESAVGYDLYAFLLTSDNNHSRAAIPPRNSRAIPTGLTLIPPKGYFLSICSRSGLALHDPPLFVANAPGIIDPNYTGEIKVILYNGGFTTYQVRHGERIAQIVVLPIIIPLFVEIDTLPTDSERGERGFGSTGE